jgi:hypothetical protein
MRFSEKKPLLFLGDNHGEWEILFQLLDHKKVESCTLIHLGDDEIGYRNNTEEEELCQNLNKEFEKRRIQFYSIRGNHCNPAYFQGEKRIRLPHFELLEDYSTALYGTQKIQFIGGAISVDRLGREPNISHWAEEKVNLDPNKCQKVDILVTHTCPSWCHPKYFGAFVKDWAQLDPNLLKDLLQERKQMDQILEICQPKFHYYGHMHSSWTGYWNGCNHRLLDINELFQHPSPH